MATSDLGKEFSVAYDNFYIDENNEWRMLCAIYKVKNIVSVCKGKRFKKVLEVGAGDGSILKRLSEVEFASEYYAVEISSSGVESILLKDIKGLISAQTFDGYKLPFEDNSFDLVILTHVLEHVEHERLLLRELKRVSESAVIEVPLDYRFSVDKRLRHFLAYGHINIYTPTLLRYLLLTEGFEIDQELTSLIPPEITSYNIFVNQKRPRLLTIRLRIKAEYWIKSVMRKYLGKYVNESFANAHTVFCKQANERPKLFDAGL